MYEIDSEEIIKAQNNDEEAMTKIIKTNSGLIWSIVKRFLGRGYDKEELEQIAYIGFIKAIKRFDTTLEFKLSTYAVPYIIGEIKRFIRDDGAIKVSRSIKELSAKIGQIQKEYITKKGEEITVEELARELKVEKEEIVVALESQRTVESIDKNVYDDENGESKISKISNQKDETTILLNKLCVEELINNLETRDKKIILLRYYKRKTQTEVAKMLGITQVQVSRLEKRILSEMKEKIVS
ncbi:MAG TPA: sigma-70 family RNA polymerase sigma factor [Clostridiaceae bacterium]|mgnify:CR=1 FL=1|jgi:RNA polymerase sigma factor, sigma-70 family|nr:rNA polymerase sigma factor [Clostridium sp. CAG:452]HJJ03072.1 sigma-70 family RNA polymerase sigma factor [Clostridiaceae bacterium]